MISNKREKNSNSEHLIPIFIGLFCFWLLGGLPTLDPTNLKWLSPGDATAGQIAWSYYKESPWTFPIGLNPMYGMKVSSSIVYGIDVPLLGVFIKLVSNFYPNQIQYVGAWYLICIVLQSYFSWKIVSLYCEDVFFKIFSTLLFTFAPALLMTIGPVASLSSHFLILNALFLSLSKDFRFRWLKWSLLLCLAIGVQFYFFIIIYSIWLGNFLDLIRNKLTNVAQALLESAVCHALPLLLAWQLGFFILSPGDTSIANYLPFEIPNLSKYSDASSSVNLVAFLYDPAWSYIENLFSAESFRFDNAYFLGVGLVLAMIFIFARNTKKSAFKILFWVKKNIFLSASILFLSIFSISNVVHIGYITFSLQLPDTINWVANMLRNSLRMIWPIYYLIFIATILLLFKSLSLIKSRFFIVLFTCIQLADTSVGWTKIRTNIFQISYQPFDKDLQNPFWDCAPKFYNGIEGIPEVGVRMSFENFSTYASKHHLPTNIALLARYDLQKILSSNLEFNQYIYTGKYKSSSFYIIDDDLIPAVLMTLDRSHDLFARIDGFNVLAPSWFEFSKDSSCKYLDIIPLSESRRPPLPSIGKSIFFGKHGLGFNYLLGMGQFERRGWGWSYPEEWGVWSEGTKAKIVMPYPKDVQPKSISLTFKSYVIPKKSSQNVKIYVDGNLSKELSFNNDNINIIEMALPVIPNKNFVVIDIRMPDAISSIQLGVGLDARKLGIGLIEAKFN